MDICIIINISTVNRRFFSTSALAQAAPPADSAQVQQSVAQETNRISINTATAEELARNSVVSGRKAQRIVEYRTENGPFTSAEQLKDVYGIGERILR